MKKKNRQRILYGFFIILALILVGKLIKDRRDMNYAENIGLVRGVDISRYQGDVDFDILYDQSIRFAFIKATEGIGHIDPLFIQNWENGKASDIKIGAYHFYRFEYSGKEQGEHFINNVSLESEDLPPVIDLEYYGEYIDNPASPNTVKEDLREMIEILYNAYGKKPIIYCNRYVYNHYIKGDFTDVDIWFRYIHKNQKFPELSDGRQWTFWQYDDKGELEGYGGIGANEYIDLNYFYGNIKELEEYGR